MQDNAIVGRFIPKSQIRIRHQRRRGVVDVTLQNGYRLISHHDNVRKLPIPALVTTQPVPDNPVYFCGCQFAWWLTYTSHHA
jgi:hypothetical protein